MGKRFYSEYVLRCLRIYATQPTPPRLTLAEIENRRACEEALRSFPPEERTLLLSLFQSELPLPAAVSRAAAEASCKPARLWARLDQLEWLVARKRGLL